MVCSSPAAHSAFAVMLPGLAYRHDDTDAARLAAPKSTRRWVGRGRPGRRPESVISLRLGDKNIVS